MADAPTLRRRALLYAAAFVALAVLVQATDFDRLNSFAVQHLQPIAGGKGHATRESPEKQSQRTQNC